MARALFILALLCCAATAQAQTPTAPPVDTDYELWKWSAPEGSEIERTTSDPGWWQRTFIGWDVNGDGRYLGGERGILIILFDFVIGFVMSMGRWLLEVLLAALPAAWKVDSSPLAQYVAIANTWVPLDYMFALASAYYFFLATFMGVKLVVKIVRGG